MKTCRNLYSELCSFENIYQAYRAARRGKRATEAVAAFEYNQEAELLRLRDEMRAQTWQPGGYHSFYIHDPKRRLISAAPFRDRVVHHALINVLEPIWEQRFIHDSYANRLAKGTHRALDRCQQFARRWRYVLQCDLQQYFPSIDHAILNAELARLVRDDKVLELCDRVIASGAGVLDEEYGMQWFAGDDLLAALRPRGLPIGNLTSQFWANVYLNRFDHFVERQLKCAGYLRYVDDFLLFSDDKAQLQRWRAEIIGYLASLRLSLHAGRAQVYPVTNGIPFLGFRAYPDHRRLKRRNGVKFQRRLRALAGQYARGETNLEQLTASVLGWINYARYADSWGLRRALLGRWRLPASTLMRPASPGAQATAGWKSP